MTTNRTTERYYKLPVDLENPEYDGRSKHDIYKATKKFKAGTAIKVVTITELCMGVDITTTRVHADGHYTYKSSDTPLGKAILKAVDGLSESEKSLQEALGGYDAMCVLETLVSSGRLSITDIEYAIYTWPED